MAATHGIVGDLYPSQRLTHPITCSPEAQRRIFNSYGDSVVLSRKRCVWSVTPSFCLYAEAPDNVDTFEHESNVVWAEKGQRCVLAMSAPFVLSVGCRNCAGSTSQFIAPGFNAARNPGTSVHRMISPRSNICTNCVRRVGTASIEFAIWDLSVCLGIDMEYLLRTTTVRFGCIGTREREVRNEVYGNVQKGASFLSDCSSFADPTSDYTVPLECSRTLNNAYSSNTISHNLCRRN